MSVEPAAAFASASPNGREDYAWDVFISYSHKDGEWVRKTLQPQLASASLRVCIDDDFDVGRAAADNMEDAVEKSRHILLVLTPDWVSSEWTAFESFIAIGLDPAGRRRRVLPLLLKRCDVPRRIAFLTYADFTDRSRETSQMARLLKAMSAAVPVQELFTARDEKTALSAKSGFVALAEMAGEPAVLPHVLRYKIVFEHTKEQIERVGKLKDLHDRLHDLQVRCYGPVLQILKQVEREHNRLSDDEATIVCLRDSELQLESNVERLHDICDGVTYLNNEQGWIATLHDSQRALQECVEKLDVDKLKLAVRGLKRVLSFQPSLINTRLNETARIMQLRALTAAMTELHEKISTNPPVTGNLGQLENGTRALERLTIALEVLVMRHDEWQALDNEIRRIESEFERDPDELTFSWPEVKLRVAKLCAVTTEDWAEQFRKDAEQVESAMQARDPARIRKSFHFFCSRETDRFYRVDKNLLKLCDDLRQVGEPLDSILRVIL